MSATFDGNFGVCIRELEGQSDVVVLQIGAGDGIQGDYLHPYLRVKPWTAILLEPVAHVYELLVANYQDCPHVRCERLAVADHDGMHELHRVGDLTGLPWWTDQLASFKRSVLLSHRDQIHDLEARIVSEFVRCVSVATLLQQFSIRHIDLLIVDVEGCDGMVVSQFLVGSVRPTYMLFEHKHLATSEYVDLAIRLRHSGYSLAPGAGDTFCWLNGNVQK